MDLNHPAPLGDPSREPAGAGDGPGRVVELVAGDFLLTVNPVDGSEIESCPPGRRPIAPRRAPDRTGPGPAYDAPLLEREEERHRLYRSLARGRSVRVTGGPGSGRTALLAAVARDCADLAPDGVIWLSGYRRTARDLLHELYAAVHQSPGYRPGPTELTAALREIGAVVVIDDLDAGGRALDELLDATPECAFLLSSRPGLPGPAVPGRVRDAALPGLSRTACLELLELAVARSLTERESAWAADLWFATEGLPLRFVQAAALLRRHGGAPDPLPGVAGLTAAVARDLPAAAQEILRCALALGGDVPAPAHLVALAGDPAAVDAHATLLAAGFLTPAGGGRYRLATPVAAELAAAGWDDDAHSRVLTAVDHYTRWLSQPAATPADAAAEAEVVVGALRAVQRAGRPAAGAALARAAAPLLAAALRWDAWENVLRAGQEASKAAGEVDRQAYFHHELGVLAICQGRLDRARAELEAATTLRAVLSDAGGTVVGRRALALVTDLARPAALPPAAPPPPAPAPGPGTPPEAVTAELPAAVPAPPPSFTTPFGAEDVTQALPSHPGDAPGRRRAHRVRAAAAAGAGAVLVAVLGTVVALGLSGGGEDPAPENGGRSDPSVTDAEPSPDDDPTSADPEERRPRDDASESPSADESPTDSGTPEAPVTPDDPVDTPDDPATDPTTDEPDPSTAGGGSSSSSGGGATGGDGGGDAGGAANGGSDDGGSDEGGAAADGGTDQGSDEGTDAGTDAGTDQGTDQGTDAGTDAGTDQGTDAGTDQGTDAGTDAGTDQGTDAGTDQGTTATGTTSLATPTEGAAGAPAPAV
jgi:hypothetical protein